MFQDKKRSIAAQHSCVCVYRWWWWHGFGLKQLCVCMYTDGGGGMVKD